MNPHEQHLAEVREAFLAKAKKEGARLRLTVLDYGMEADWIDPVESLEETADGWTVSNGHHSYFIPRHSYRSVELRAMDGGA